MIKNDSNKYKGLKIALIGLGKWGANLFRILDDLGVLCCICDKNIHVLKLYQQYYKNLYFSLSTNEVLLNSNINAVVIATPTETHFELSKKALLSGKDVFVEKPLALSVREAEELVNLSQKRSRILMVGHILHYHPAIIQLKNLLKSQILGRIQFLYSYRSYSVIPGHEKNLLWDLLPHDLSLFISLVNKLFKIKFSFEKTQKIKNVLLTTFFQGGHGRIFIEKSKKNEVERKWLIVGSEAIICLDFFNYASLKFYPIKNKIFAEKQLKTILNLKMNYIYEIPLENKEALQNEFEHFLYCLSNRKNPFSDGEESLRIIKLIEELESV